MGKRKAYIYIMEANLGCVRLHSANFVERLSMIESSFENMMRLSELKAGEAGLIQGFTTSDLELKLMEMGCIPGEKIMVEKIAPLGDPISIRVAGYSLSLRKDEANQILLEIV